VLREVEISPEVLTNSRVFALSDIPDKSKAGLNISFESLEMLPAVSPVFLKLRFQRVRFDSVPMIYSKNLCVHEETEANIMYGRAISPKLNSHLFLFL